MISLRVPKTIKQLLISTLLISFVTGGLFFILNNWITIEGEFGPEKHPLQFPTLQLHAAAGFVMILLYGAFWGSHVPLAWRSKRARNTGVGLALFIGIQILTAYLLYYLANEQARTLTAWTHLGVGMCLPLFLFLHIRSKTKRSKVQQ